jgi:protein tyrosine phosphatase
MEQPSADSGYYPFSITAGIEQGTKNRYKNIWPFDYTRVRLASPPDKSDYINASFVQPRGTSRRYIATQGPMDSTFSDFWTLVWEQDVHVIVM